MESNIKIASRIIIFFNKIRYVIRYVGFRDVIISIHVEKKEKYVEDLIYYCWIVEEKYWISSILYQRKKTRFPISLWHSISSLQRDTRGHFSPRTLWYFGETHFSCLIRFFIFLQRGTYISLRDKYTRCLEYSNLVTICTLITFNFQTIRFQYQFYHQNPKLILETQISFTSTQHTI